MRWLRCADGGAVCEPLAVLRHDWAGNRYGGAEPGATAAGTVFELVVERDGETLTRRTPVWRGPPVAAPPTLSGTPIAGETVRVTPGEVSGGWASPNVVSTSIVACTEPAGGVCHLYAYGPSAQIGEGLVGWYLFAAQSWQSGNNGVSWIPEAAPPTWGPFPSGRSAALGPVCCAPPVATPEAQSVRPPVAAKRPTASVRARALRRNGKLIVGRVRCETRCTVALKVSGGNRRALHRTFVATGAKALTVPVRHGKLKVRVVVDGSLVASGTVRAR